MWHERQNWVLLEAIHLRGEAHANGEKRKCKESEERDDFADGRCGHSRTKDDNRNQYDTEDDEEKDKKRSKFHQGAPLGSAQRDVMERAAVTCRASECRRRRP